MNFSSGMGIMPLKSQKIELRNLKSLSLTGNVLVIGQAIVSFVNLYICQIWLRFSCLLVHVYVCVLQWYLVYIDHEEPADRIELHFQVIQIGTCTLYVLCKMSISGMTVIH